MQTKKQKKWEAFPLGCHPNVAGSHAGSAPIPSTRHAALVPRVTLGTRARPVDRSNRWARSRLKETKTMDSCSTEYPSDPSPAFDFPTSAPLRSGTDGGKPGVAEPGDRATPCHSPCRKVTRPGMSERLHQRHFSAQSLPAGPLQPSEYPLDGCPASRIGQACALPATLVPRVTRGRGWRQFKANSTVRYQSRAGHLSDSNRPSTKFIGGQPTNPATKRFAGR